jgi:hypothetical protein
MYFFWKGIDVFGYDMLHLVFKAKQVTVGSSCPFGFTMNCGTGRDTGASREVVASTPSLSLC